MSIHERFNFKNKDELLRKIEELNVDLPFSENIQVLFDKVRIAGKEIANRFVVHPMEGFDAELGGAPGELTFRRYKRYAAGGSALIWFEATAVVEEGRSNPRQLKITKKNLHLFKSLVDETRKSAQDFSGENQDILLILQLTHSGRYSKPNGTPQPVIVQHSPGLDAIHQLPEDYPVITDEELDDLHLNFVSAAELAEEAGFDGVDIKACHHYLVSELLASFTRENSKYGGSLENRVRFLIETIKKIKQNCDKIFVTSRLNLYDAVQFPFGFGVDKNNFLQPDLKETKKLVARLYDDGMPILNTSIGNPYLLPHFCRPFNSPVKGKSTPPEHPLESVARLIRIVGEVQKEFPELPLVGTGYSWLRHYFPNVAAAVVESGAVSLVGQGRGAFAYPDSVNDLARTGKMNPRKTCTGCSGCTQIMIDGGRTGCIVRDKEIYGLEYRNARKRKSQK